VGADETTRVVLDSAGRLGKILTGMNRVLGDIPLTVKFRTGVKSDKNVAHKLIPRFANEWGISAMTVGSGTASSGEMGESS
jgi:tRNA-dihydrouridine synthase 3